MTQEELAKQFAAQKVEELSAIVEEAYLKGYEQGCIDSDGPITIDGVTYVDLGLPSETLWSSWPLEYCDYGYKQRRFSYRDACQLSLPSVEQWDEVCQFCHFDGRFIIGLSGERIGYDIAPAGYFIRSLGEGCEEEQNMFWLKGDVDEENNAPTMVYDIITNIENEIENVLRGASRHFIGYKLPVFLVKNKE